MSGIYLKTPFFQMKHRLEIMIVKTELVIEAIRHKTIKRRTPGATGEQDEIAITIGNFGHYIRKKHRHLYMPSHAGYRLQHQK